MTEAPVASLMRLAQWAVRDWQTHPHFDDMLAEAYLEAWVGYQRGLDLGEPAALAFAAKRAAWGPSAWVRKWRGQEKSSPHRYHARHVPLEDAAEVPVADDALRALDRIEAEQLWELVWRVCRPSQAEVLYRYYVAQQTLEEIGLHLGITERQARNGRDVGLTRLRKFYAAPWLDVSRPVESYPRCARGHYLCPENVIREHSLQQRCRECKRQNMRDFRERRR